MTGRQTPDDDARRRAPRQEAVSSGLPAGPPPLDGAGADGRLPFGRRRRTAASALVAVLVAFGLGLLFNAQAMHRTALAMPFGEARSIRLAFVRPLADVSHWLLLDRPAELTAEALGRPQPGPPAQAQVAQGTPTPSAAPSGDKGGRPQKPMQEKPLPKPYKGHPLHLYIAGDSMMGLPGMALVNLSSKTKLIKPKLDYHISTGLCRPDFFNWPAELAQQVKTFDPGAVALMFGANDNQALQTSSGRIYQFASAGWKKEYRKRVEQVIGLLFQGGVRRVYWLGQPAMPSATFNSQIELVNDIYRDVAARTFGVEYIDTYALLSRNGQYAQYLPAPGGRMQQVREQDGEHLTYAGGLIVAQAVMDAIRREWFPQKATGSPPSPGRSRAATPAP
jgi:hypothetical protein